MHKPPTARSGIGVILQSKLSQSVPEKPPLHGQILRTGLYIKPFSHCSVWGVVVEVVVETYMNIKEFKSY